MNNLKTPYKLILTCLFFLMVLPVFSQSYKPVLKLDRIWGVEWSLWYETPPEVYTAEYTLTDTVHIDSNVYYIPEYQIPIDSVIFREDSLLKRVYAYNIFQQDEYIVMDFSLELGDTVPENFRCLDRFGYYEEDPNASVVSVDSVEINDGSLRKRITVQTNTIECMLIEMIEGLGGSMGYVSAGSSYFEQSRRLSCVKDNEALIYGFCEPISLDEEEDNMVEIYPNPIINTMSIKSDTPNTVEIYNILGELVYKSQEAKLNHHLDFNAVESGIYIVKGLNVSNGQVFIQKVVKE